MLLFLIPPFHSVIIPMYLYHLRILDSPPYLNRRKPHGTFVSLFIRTQVNLRVNTRSLFPKDYTVDGTLNQWEVKGIRCINRHDPEIKPDLSFDNHNHESLSQNYSYVVLLFVQHMVSVMSVDGRWFHSFR